MAVFRSTTRHLRDYVSTIYELTHRVFRSNSLLRLLVSPCLSQHGFEIDSRQSQKDESVRHLVKGDSDMNQSRGCIAGFSSFRATMFLNHQKPKEMSTAL
jgi:hypothetical protein